MPSFRLLYFRNKVDSGKMKSYVAIVVLGLFSQQGRAFLLHGCLDFTVFFNSCFLIFVSRKTDELGQSQYITQHLFFFFAIHNILLVIKIHVIELNVLVFILLWTKLEKEILTKQ